jgi:hypothetical protein
MPGAVASNILLTLSFAPPLPVMSVKPNTQQCCLGEKLNKFKRMFKECFRLVRLTGIDRIACASLAFFQPSVHLLLSAVGSVPINFGTIPNKQSYG